MARKKHPEPEHSWAETRGLHPTDVMLRGAGFKIHARPRKGTALWTRAGEIYTERDAWELACEESKRR